MKDFLNHLFWHDGNLIDISFAITKNGQSTLKITMLLYKDEQAKNRDIYRVKCQKVTYFNSTINTTELKRNTFAGHISNAYLKKNTLWIYLVDGFLEVHAKDFSVKVTNQS